ncbi:hypothetical protein GW17_00008362 [Ensete ventricosum]|nr:hypothetical protein GW17_00008362 [Ensete ventricosum]
MLCFGAPDAIHGEHRSLSLRPQQRPYPLFHLHHLEPLPPQRLQALRHAGPHLARRPPRRGLPPRRPHRAGQPSHLLRVEEHVRHQHHVGLRHRLLARAPPQLAHLHAAPQPVGLRAGSEAREERGDVGEHHAGRAHGGRKESREARPGAQLEDGSPGKVGASAGGHPLGEVDGGVPEPGAGEGAASGGVAGIVSLVDDEPVASDLHLSDAHFHCCWIRWLMVFWLSRGSFLVRGQVPAREDFVGGRASQRGPSDDQVSLLDRSISGVYSVLELSFVCIVSKKSPLRSS